MQTPILSVVIPVYNEEPNLALLFNRLSATLDTLLLPFEIIFVNDGSQDRSLDLLHQFHQQRPHHVSIIDFKTNFGQHMAIIAGFEHVRGTYVVTLDADLQNPPEEIPKLLQQLQAGHDVVGGYRTERKDVRLRRWLSKANNWLRRKITHIEMTDQGCMLRGYHRQIVDLIVKSGETTVFIPALAYTYANNPTEIEVDHNHRHAGDSKYNLYSLVRLNFDMMTGFSLVPLQIFTFVGILVSLSSGLLVAYLLTRRLLFGPDVEGVFTLFAIEFFLVGLLLMGLGITGEYIGRIYLAVRQRPRFLIRDKVIARDE